MYLRSIKHEPDEDYNGIMAMFLKPKKQKNNNVPFGHCLYRMWLQYVHKDSVTIFW